MNLLVETHPKNNERFFNENVDWIKENQKSNDKNNENYVEKIKIKESEEIKQENIQSGSNDDTISKNAHNIPFRVLSLTYLVHVLAFTYASLMKSN
jgi:hypothetical protein